MADKSRLLDLLIIGGGINGTAIARDAAGRGLKVALFEQQDLGQHTASASVKLSNSVKHQPRDAQVERETLLRIAPHIVWPLDIIAPLAKQPPSPPIRLGFPWKNTAAPRKVKLATHAAAAMLKPEYQEATSQTDTWVEDSRLVVLNAMDAAARGAKIFPRTKIISARPEDGLWKAETARMTFHARAIINAAGARVNAVLNNQLGRNTAPALRLVKSSHIITRKLYPENHALMLRAPDMRNIYVIPYERAFTLIGTADASFEGDLANAVITEAETTYLCESVNTYFDFAITPNDAIWTYSGVRALPANGHGYTLDLAKDPGSPPLLSVYGGSVATFRKLAEQAVEKIAPAIGRAAGKSWTAAAPLPGGDTDDIATYARMFRAFNTHLDGATARRLVYSYGTRVSEFVQPQMGHDFGNGLTRAEVDYLVCHEWARTAEDILWRRTKLGLHVPADTEQRLTAYLARDRF